VTGALAADFHETRRISKHQKIAQAAAEVFVAKGYPSASVDEIAKRAGVSKQTVYKHFVSKENLFLVVTTAATDGITNLLAAQLEASRGDSTDVATELTTFARILGRLVLEPEMMALRRLVMTELVRFPELGRSWYRHGPGRVVVQLSRRFRELTETGYLSVDNPQQAAENFNWLVLAPPQNKILFGEVDRFTEAEIDKMAADAVKVFLAAYRARP
jgi:AcrR family transcriptional regulator